MLVDFKIFAFRFVRIQRGPEEVSETRSAPQRGPGEGSENLIRSLGALFGRSGAANGGGCHARGMLTREGGVSLFKV